jgi:hypothetical protein
VGAALPRRRSHEASASAFFLICGASRFRIRIRFLVTWEPNEEHGISLTCPRKNAVSLAISVNEDHDFSNFGYCSGFKVLSLDCFEPVFHFERMHAESALSLPPRKNPAIR